MFISDRVRSVLSRAPEGYDGTGEHALRDPSWKDAVGWTVVPTAADMHVTVDMVVRRVAAAVRRTASVAGEGRRTPPVYPTPWPRTREDTTTLRPHQRAAVTAVVGDDDDGASSAGASPRSGWWIMPCGAGKTLTAAALCVRATGPVLWVVPSLDTFPQIEAAFRKLASSSDKGRAPARAVRNVGTASMSSVLCINPETHDRDARTVWVVTWKAMSTHFQRPQGTARSNLLAALECQQYALVVLDEGHMQPAATHSHAVSRLRADVRLGMTACTARADGKQDTLGAEVGPVLHVTTHKDAVDAGLVVPPPRRTLLVVPPHEKTRQETTLRADGKTSVGNHSQSLACGQDVHKLWTLQTLLLRQTDRKVMVYCDRLAPMGRVSAAVSAVPGVTFLGAVDGSTPRARRDRVIQAFVKCRAGAVVFSHTGSASLDVPDLACIIEFGLTDGAVQKGVQRAGRLARAHLEKPVSPEYYTIVCEGTKEHAFALRRNDDIQKRAVDAGCSELDVVRVQPRRKDFFVKEVPEEEEPHRTERDEGRSSALSSAVGRKRDLGTGPQDARSKKKM
jgi:DNA excision repair protein ERCC-3